MASSLEEKLLLEGGGRRDDEENGDGEGRSLEDLRSTVSDLASFCRKQISATTARRKQWRLETPKPISSADEEAKEEDRSPWRKKLGEILESTTTQVILLSLLLLDLVATIVDVLHTLHNNSHDLDTCISLLESCTCTTSSSSFSESSEWEALSYVGIFVLSILLLNLLGLLVSLGPIPFFSHPGYLLDAVVVIVALFLELFLDTDTVSLLVILNLWRIIRVAHGVFEFTDSAWERNLEKLEAQMESVERMRARDLQTIRYLQDRIRQLES